MLAAIKKQVDVFVETEVGQRRARMRVRREELRRTYLSIYILYILHVKYVRVCMPAR